MKKGTDNIINSKVLFDLQPSTDSLLNRSSLATYIAPSADTLSIPSAQPLPPASRRSQYLIPFQRKTPQETSPNPKKKVILERTNLNLGYSKRTQLNATSGEHHEPWKTPNTANAVYRPVGPTVRKGYAS